MAELETIETTGAATAESALSVDLLIAVSGPVTQEDLRARAEKAIQQFTTSPSAVRIGVAYPGSASSQPEAEIAGSPIACIPYSMPPSNASFPGLTSAAACRGMEELLRRTRARCCVVIGPDLAALDGAVIQSLGVPLLENRAELAVPLYPVGKYDGLLNSSILYPVTRALYGKRARYPLTPDFGISSRLLSRLSSEQMQARHASQTQPVTWPVTEAILADAPIVQSNIGIRHSTQSDGMDLSTVLGMLVGSLFQEIEENAALWQRVRGSQPVPTIGVPVSPPADANGIDVKPMIESFMLGSRNLQELWGLVLPPVTLLELKRMSRLTPEQFRMPDALWARIVYDFALAYRLRTISRTHLLGALTPLYLGWVASHVMEISAMNALAVEQRIEQLAKAYEDGKPYLVSRWRWPDRFNP